jgi:preprotein translocase subunit SecD
VSLPGIAAIILSIGMGVDANVIIFERVKEELRNGKTLRSAIDIGFKRAFSAVLDANITTLISALVLLYFGTGSIKSFAITLALGVALNFLTAVTASRIMLKAVSGLDIMKHRWLYGVKGGSQNA